jgi:hypothetical protein
MINPGWRGDYNGMLTERNDDLTLDIVEDIKE